MSKHTLAALSSPLFTPSWWKAAALRGLRTAITIAIPYLGTAILFSGVPWLSVASAAGLGFVASLITSLAGIPEADGKTVPAWLALLERTTKTVAQGIAAGLVNAVLFTDVHWSVIVQAALISGLGSLLLGVLGFLPEASEVQPVAIMPTPVQRVSASNVAAQPTTPSDPSQPAAGVPPAGVPASS